MNNLITLADFKGIVAVSANISADLVDPYITDAQLIDVWPLLPQALRDELSTPRPGWLAATEKLFTEHVLPLLVVEATRRLTLWHGTHFTPAGIEDLASDLNRTPASSQRRAVLSADLQAKAAYYRPLLEIALRTAYPPTGATYCGGPIRRPGRGGFSSTAL